MLHLEQRQQSSCVKLSHSVTKGTNAGKYDMIRSTNLVRIVSYVRDSTDFFERFLYAAQVSHLIIDDRNVFDIIGSSA